MERTLSPTEPRILISDLSCCARIAIYAALKELPGSGSHFIADIFTARTRAAGDLGIFDGSSASLERALSGFVSDSLKIGLSLFNSASFETHLKGQRSS